MILGNRRDLKENDLYRVVPDDESESLGLRLQAEWRKEMKKLNKRNGPKPSLFLALARTFGSQFLLLAVPAFLEECVFK